MKTLVFIGSDKNAGKTTALNFIYHRRWVDWYVYSAEEKPLEGAQLLDSSKQLEVVEGKRKLCKFILTSIGINGEEFDTYENYYGTLQPKPQLSIKKGDFFITTFSRLSRLSGLYRVVCTFMGAPFKKSMLLGESLVPELPIILEGPNELVEVMAIKKKLQELQNEIKEDLYLLVDGSIDRQFLGRKEVCDELYFSLLISGRGEQIQKAKNLLFPLLLKESSAEVKEYINTQKNQKPSGLKSLLFNLEKKEILYEGYNAAFLDLKLKKAVSHALKSKKILGSTYISNSKPSSKVAATKIYLYLNSALTPKLYEQLIMPGGIAVILDNFTLYQNITTDGGFRGDSRWRQSMSREQGKFDPFISSQMKIQLLNRAPLKKIFWQADEVATYTMISTLLNPFYDIPHHNLYREDPDEIGVGTEINS